MMNKTMVTFLILALVVGGCTIKEATDERPLLVRKPYLQSAIADSVTVLWRSSAGSEAKVGYRQRGAKEWMYQLGSTRITNTDVVENEVTLKALIPNTIYQYEIFTDDVSLLADDSLAFRSVSLAQDAAFSFFAVGDIGEPVEEGGTPDLLGKVLEPLVDSLRFGLLLGDLVYPHGKSENYDKRLFQYFGNVFPYLPVFTLLGNHDWHEPEKNYMQEWKLPGNEHYYSFDFGNVHFIGLDSKKGTLYEYEEQVNWLEEDLQKRSDAIDWTVVFVHHNGKSCTYKGDNESVMSLYPLFEKYQVDLVLNGHAHTYERLNPMNGNGEVEMKGVQTETLYQPNGFVSITIGSGGKLRGIGSDPKPFEPNPEACEHEGLVAAYAHKWAFLKLDVLGKKLKARAIGTETSETLDQFEIIK